MKKSLLILSSIALTGFAAYAVTPELVPDTYAMGISPNGKWGSSNMYGMTSIVNLTTGEVTNLDEEVEVGNGNNIANNGTVVLSLYDQAYIYVNDECKEFDTDLSETYALVWLSGITPDATRIAGSYTPNENRGEMNTFPAVWDIDADGTPTKMTELPYPTVDFTGRMPQGCNALVISSDGKTIVGHLVDFSGMFVEPIIYTQGEDGEWSYSLPAEHLLNPDNIELPEDPGEYPESVDPKDYMSEEKATEYQEAMDEYYQTWDEDIKPDPADYMTDEQIAAYNEAVDEYNEEAEAYNEKFYAFYEALDEINATATKFMYNGMMLSPDGKTVAAGAQLEEGEDFMTAKTYNYTVLINLETSEITKLPIDQSVYPIQVLNNGVLLGINSTAMGAAPPQAFIKLPENEDYIPFEDYIKDVDTEAYDWMIENLTKEIELYDMTTWEEYTTEFLFTGTVWMSDDLKTVFAGIQTYYWENEDPSDTGFCSYIISDALSSVSNVTVGKSDIKVSAKRGGIINIAGDATRVTVYDLTGREVFSAPAAASVATGLGNGAYIVKVDSAAGTKTAKVVF